MDDSSHYMLDLNRECFVEVKKLSSKEISEWTVTQGIIVPDLNETPLKCMKLQACKPKVNQQNARLLCSVSQNVNYTGMDDDEYVEYDPDTKPKPQKYSTWLWFF